ncbi:MAG: hypothetical protein M3N11_04900 [Actinomycetota bacterium]|nr:hypothetical protein [Actinomycetota bacterium]
MFTLIVCLAVVALSAAVVLRIVAGEETQPATPPQPPRGRPSSPGPQEAAAPAANHHWAPTRPASAPARHRVRSAVLLVLLLATVGALLALAVAVALRLLVMGVRAGVG